MNLEINGIVDLTIFKNFIVWKKDIFSLPPRMLLYLTQNTRDPIASRAFLLE